MTATVAENRTTSRGRATFPKGVHPAERKHFAAEAAIEVLPPPREVRIPLLQHLGAPCSPIHKPRTEVALGEVMWGATKSLLSSAVLFVVMGLLMWFEKL